MDPAALKPAVDERLLAASKVHRFFILAAGMVVGGLIVSMLTHWPLKLLMAYALFGTVAATLYYELDARARREAAFAEATPLELPAASEPPEGA